MLNTYISMLRGINVSGQKKVPMAELRSLYEGLSLANVQTYVQSGNVIFNSDEKTPSILTGQIEAQIEQSFGFAVPVFIRDTEDFRRIIHSNPYLQGRNEDPAKLHVTFLYGPPSETAIKNIKAPEDEADEFSIGEQEIYLFCPNGYGRTKLNNNFFERKLGLLATTRNWKTVNTLYTMAAERSG